MPTVAVLNTKGVEVEKIELGMLIVNAGFHLNFSLLYPVI